MQSISGTPKVDINSTQREITMNAILLLCAILLCSVRADLGCDKHKQESQCISSADCAWCTSCTSSCLDAVDAATLPDSVFDCVYGSGVMPAKVAAGPSAGFGFEVFSRTNTKNVTLPTTTLEAEKLGWKVSTRVDGTGLCRTGLGVEYTENVPTHSKARPMSLFFDPNTGEVSAFSLRAWFSSENNYNPLTWKLPDFGVMEHGERWVTVTMRDPAAICPTSATVSHFKGANAAACKTMNNKSNTMLGDRLIVNLDAANLSIPTTVPTDSSGKWKSGACMANMSRHWAYPLDGQLSSLLGTNHGKDVLPVIPMYSVSEGGVTALAFFTTEPQQTFGNGGIWDATGTPAQLCAGNFCEDAAKCQYGPEGNSVFHVFFIDQWSAPAQCGPEGSPGCPAGKTYNNNGVKMMM